MASRFSLGGMIDFLGVPRPSKVQPTKTAGVGGFTAYGGVVDTGERNAKLADPNQRWTTYSDILTNVSIVAASVRYFLNLVAKSNWKVEPAALGDEEPTDDAIAAAEFLESVIYDMDTSWSRVVRRSAMLKFHGFSIQEWTAKNRDDGQIGLQDIQSRPTHTITGWDLDANGAVLGVVQTNPKDFTQIYLPRAKIVYLVDDTLTDSPQGMGMLRHLVEPAERLKAYLRQEGFGYERDLSGIPIGRAPLAEIERLVAAKTITEKEGAAMKGIITDIVKMQVKQRDTGIVLDSAIYKGASSDGETISSTYKWALDLLTGGGTAFGDMNEAINRLNREMARILGTEQMMLGETAGSRSLSEDKSQSLFMQVEAILGDMAEGYERDVVGPIWALNGLDDDLRPTLKFEAVEFRDVQKIAAALRDMSVAGAMLQPDDPAIDDVRDLLGVSRSPQDGLAVSLAQATLDAKQNPAPPVGFGAPGGAPTR